MVEKLNLRRTGVAKFAWKPSPKEMNVTSYRVEKSTDSGSTFSLEISISNDTTSPNYDIEDAEFFYEDNAPTAGQIVRVRAEASGSVGPWAYAFMPPERPATCTVFFALVDSLSGLPLSDIRILISVCKLPKIEDSSLPSVEPGSVFAVQTQKYLLTNTDGMAQLDILQGSVVEVSIEALKSCIKFLVPAQDTLNFADAGKHAIHEHEYHPGRA